MTSSGPRHEKPIIAFAQELLRAGLDPWRRTRRRQEIAAYARQVAGTGEDMDPRMERAGIESLTDER